MVWHSIKKPDKEGRYRMWVPEGFRSLVYEEKAERPEKSTSQILNEIAERLKEMKYRKP